MRSPHLKLEAARRTAAQMIGKTTVNINAKHYRPFGCPCYVLANALQQNNPYHKWRERAKVGIYLGPSAQHGRNVALVLDRKTGLVSPQFHVTYDPTFSVATQDKFNSEWQIKAGFVAQRGKTATSQKATRQTGATSPPPLEAFTIFSQWMGPCGFSHAMKLDRRTAYGRDVAVLVVC